ncbi:MAG: NADH-quinone oxidoreductase subunit F, partial [Candidatus Eisenbacteria bacterium]|nr:NADH-quinone oxidoreductase subunit F [Candidatus Latescibacterota bacterium]MBD3302477.1 NADH-quinone oxidoreductase subunit F [Candidatus Eisenbacteria bacterium]
MDRPLTRNVRDDGEMCDRAAYEKTGGYEAVGKVLGKMKPEEVTALVKEANLRGRGGAGFNTGMKWGFVPMGDDAPKQKYLIANADEMEPGTFKDRLLMEADPHLLIEGMILAAYAIQAPTAYVFLRWAYRLSEHRLLRAIAEAEEAGYLGKNILGSGFDLEMHVHVSAGRYMCGEETGLLNALEGKRANPRAKPPFPQASGLFGKPTIVQNVETLCNV